MSPSAPPPAKRRIYVVAGSHTDYHQYLREQHLLARDAVFLRRAEQVRGVENPEVRYVTGWKTVKDIDAINRAILEQQRPV